jgi:hypothetical protein
MIKFNHPKYGIYLSITQNSIQHKSNFINSYYSDYMFRRFKPPSSGPPFGRIVYYTIILSQRDLMFLLFKNILTTWELGYS